IARPNELEIASHVESIPTGNLVLLQRLLRDRLILAINLGVAAIRKASLRRALDDLAAAAALPGVLTGDLRVLRPDFRIGGFALDVRVVSGSPPGSLLSALPALSALTLALALTLSLTLPLSLSFGEHQ